MKKLLLMIVAFVSLFGYAQTKDSAFLSKVTNDLSRNSYYVSLKVENENNFIQSIIPNGQLYYYYLKEKGMREAGYKKFIRNIIAGNKSIRVSANNLKKYGFIKVGSNVKIDAEAKKRKK